MELQIDKNFDNELKKIEFYKNSEIHQLMLPYIGFKYEECRVLLVAESHYLKNEEDRKKVDDFEKWYTDKGNISLSCPKYIYTRGVVDECFSRGNVFFQRIKKELEKANIDIKHFWERVSFMNFFVVPSTNGSRGIFTTKEIEEKSLNNFEEVIKVLKPDCVLFLSKKSYYIFEKQNSEYLKNTYAFCHPTSAWWYRKRKNGKKSADEFREKIEMIFKN